MTRDEEVHVTWLRHRVYARGPTWLEKARAHAIEVQEFRTLNNLSHKHGYKPTSREANLENDVNAFAAEIAVSLYTGLDWNPVVGISDKADVGEDVEVKCRARRYAEYLVDAPPINPHRRYVVTYGRDPDLWLAGWVYGEHAANLPVKVFTESQSGGHAIAADRLLPMWSFPEVARAVRGA